MFTWVIDKYIIVYSTQQKYAFYNITFVYH